MLLRSTDVKNLLRKYKAGLIEWHHTAIRWCTQTLRQTKSKITLLSRV